MYPPDSMPLPKTLRDPAGPARMRFRAAGQLNSVENFTDAELRSRISAYYGATSYVDHLMGLLVGALVETNRFDNTLFIFTSDHGEMLGNHGLSAKGAVFYEDLMNIPLLIRPPGGLARSHQTPRLVSQVDLVPTILKWCGVPVPSELQGKDIRSLVEGSQTAVNEGIGYEFHSNNWGDKMYPLRGWRTEDWKYVDALGGDNELYDLRNDPSELNNLFGKPDAAAQQRRMEEALRDWLKRTNDPWPKIPKHPSMV
jgi:uncharacterized sulfatase